MIDERRELVQELEDDPRVKDVDFTRDGYQTVVLELADSDGGESR